MVAVHPRWYFNNSFHLKTLSLRPDPWSPVDRFSHLSCGFLKLLQSSKGIWSFQFLEKKRIIGVEKESQQKQTKARHSINERNGMLLIEKYWLEGNDLTSEKRQMGWIELGFLSSASLRSRMCILETDERQRANKDQHFSCSCGIIHSVQSHSQTHLLRGAKMHFLQTRC